MKYLKVFESIEDDWVIEARKKLNKAFPDKGNGNDFWTNIDSGNNGFIIRLKNFSKKIIFYRKVKHKNETIFTFYNIDIDHIINVINGYIDDFEINKDLEKFNI